MSEYFPVQLAGVGTWEVEHLRSFFYRFADLHGVSQRQLMAHLQATFTERTEPKQANPEYLLYTKSMAITSYGNNVERLVQLLERATGLANLRSATLLPISSVASPNAAFALESHRRWCPACYREDIARGLVYDRLFWCIKGVNRCPVHECLLQDVCPACLTRQHCYGNQSGFTRCRKCGADLSIVPPESCQQTRPSLVERDAVETMALIGNEPHLQINSREVLYFFQYLWPQYRLVSRKYRKKRKGYDSLPTVRPPHSPTLMMMMTIAALAEIPLTLILQEPLIARVLLDTNLFYQDYVPQVKHFWHEERDRKRLKERLEALCCDVELVETFSLKRELSGAGFTPGLARYWYPDLCRRIAQVKRLSKERRREYYLHRIREQLVRIPYLRRFRNCGLRTVKDVVKHVAEWTGAPVHMVRAEVNKALADPDFRSYGLTNEKNMEMQLSRHFPWMP